MELGENNKTYKMVRRTQHLRDLFSPGMVAFAWTPVVLFCAFHYLTGVHEDSHWLHDIYRRLYYIPILYAALQRGIWGGAVLALVVSVSYAPHAFHHYFENDPGSELEKGLEILLYNIIGILCGGLADRQEAKRVEAEEALLAEREARLELQRAHRLAALGELVAGISHEIKNPLHTIRGAIEIVDKIVPKDIPEAEMWQIVKDELKRLSRIADRFLSFARPQPPELRLILLQKLLARTEELLAAQARQNAIKLIVEKSIGPGELSVYVDIEQIVQVLIDIAVNGFHAMEKTLTPEMLIYPRIETQNGKDYAVITVQNSGPTIEEDHLERIFDPFFTTRSSGTGLGLSTAARIVAQHGGFMVAQNVDDQEGVVFKVYLPIKTT